MFYANISCFGISSIIILYYLDRHEHYYNIQLFFYHYFYNNIIAINIAEQYCYDRNKHLYIGMTYTGKNK